MIPTEEMRSDQKFSDEQNWSWQSYRGTSLRTFIGRSLAPLAGQAYSAHHQNECRMYKPPPVSCGGKIDHRRVVFGGGKL